jgi:ribonuclease HIII
LKWVVGGSSSKLKDGVIKICKEVFGDQGKTRSPERNSISLIVSNQNKQTLVQEYLTKSDDVIMEQEKNCLYRAKIIRNGNVVFVRQFHSGTLRVDGPQDQFKDVLSKIQNILGVSEEAISQALLPAQKELDQINAIKSIDLGSQWIGTDESGKGDYYGPLVGAAVLVDDQTAHKMEELGIKDSKKLSDKRVHDLAVLVKQVCGERAQVIPISPEKYNELYRQFVKEGKNLNTLLAWAHTRGIENIVEKYGIEDITVIVDKFADESYIQSKLLEGGRKANLNIIQLPKAEANIAVAAASVLARSEFLKRLNSLSSKYGLDLPKGASDPRVIDVGKSIVKKFGKGELGKVAKLHFKTTKKIIDSS